MSERYEWGNPPFPKFPHETVDSMAEIGESFMERMPKDYSWCQSPAEVICDLTNERDGAREEVATLSTRLAQAEQFIANRLHEDDSRATGKIGPRWWCLRDDLRDAYLKKARASVEFWASREAEMSAKYSRVDAEIAALASAHRDEGATTETGGEKGEGM